MHTLAQLIKLNNRGGFMELLNKVGLDVLEHKKELSNSSHSKIVKKALESAVTELLKGDIITTTVHEAIRDVDTSYDEVRSLILDVPNLIKTEQELTGEFDTLRIPFAESIKKELSDSSLSKLSSESHVREGEIQFILSFQMTKEFIAEYFERDGDQLDVMMRPEGFAEKFAILRFNALISKLLKKQESYDDIRKRAFLTEDVEIGATKVFVNKDEELFGVELVYHIPVNVLESEEQVETLKPKLITSIQDAAEFINIRLIT